MDQVTGTFPLLFCRAEYNFSRVVYEETRILVTKRLKRSSVLCRTFTGKRTLLAENAQRPATSSSTIYCPYLRCLYHRKPHCRCRMEGSTVSWAVSCLIAGIVVNFATETFPHRLNNSEKLATKREQASLSQIVSALPRHLGQRVTETLS